MKITVEPAQLPETEVIIRGDIAGAEVAAILQLLGKKNSGKLFVFQEEEQYILSPGEIVFAETNGSKVLVYGRQEIYESRQKLYQLMELLDGFAFAQINKSTIVNIEYVKSIQAEFSGNYRIKLKDRKEVLTVSRKYFKEFKNKVQEG